MRKPRPFRRRIGEADPPARSGRGLYGVTLERVRLGKPVDVEALDRTADAALLWLDVAVLTVSLRLAMARAADW